MKQRHLVTCSLLGFWVLLFASEIKAQDSWDRAIAEILPQTLEKHRTFVSLPNVSANASDIQKNMGWAKTAFEHQGFKVSLLPSETLPIFFAEKKVSDEATTVLIYLHIDGQPVDASKWDQEDPFQPVLKKQNEQGHWEQLPWDAIQETIDPEWRIFGRAAADDKAPIMMLLTAMELLEAQNEKLAYNLKVILDPQEEAGSEAFLSTLATYKSRYQADYLFIMDGPAHPSNKPTLTFGCRGIATCSITTYGAKLPQHSGHYGNYAPNPVFNLSRLLASMKDENGKVTIEGYYDGIEMTSEVKKLLENVPDVEKEIQKGLGIARADGVAEGYQESLQYPSLNVRHIETSWKGPGLKTVIPEIATAHIDVRLVSETDGALQLEKIRKHLVTQGYLVLDRDPTDTERLNYAKMVRFDANKGVNAFRTDMEAPIGKKLRNAFTKYFGAAPISIRTMGGTVPIIPAINSLDIPAVIIPMVNMDNNQHNPNENIRIGNMSQGIKMCMVLFTLNL